MSIIGYIYLHIESATLNGSEEPIKTEICLSAGSRTETAMKPSGQAVNEVFLMEVPKEPTKLIFNLHNA